MDSRRNAGTPGGYWEVIDEVLDPRVVRQLTKNCCGPACAQMLFADRGLTLVTQEWIVAAQGHERSASDILPAAMNEILARLGFEGRLSWKGANLDVLAGLKDVFESLAATGAFITSMTSFGSDSHMVVIDGRDETGRVLIRDPYEGTSYKMTWQAFCNAWEGITIWSMEHLR